VTSNAPSVERVRHAETIEPPAVDASSFRQGWRVRTRLDALLAAGRINAGVWQAAVEYRDAWARVWAGRGGELGGTRVSGGLDLHRRQIGLVDTVAALDAIERRLGRLATSLCVACVVEDLSWPEIGRRCGRSNHTAVAWTVLALRALARAWATRPGRGRDGFAMRPEPRRRVRAS
jgi:hypothetical protein